MSNTPNRAIRGPTGLAEAGLPEDPALFKVLTEINMIAHLADTEFSRLLPAGLTPAQFGVLNRLVRLRALETISELARAFQVAQPTMTSTVRRLADKGLINVTSSETDRRARVVTITREGEEQRELAIAAVGPLFREFTDSVDGIDFDALMLTLMELRSYLEARA